MFCKETKFQKIQYKIWKEICQGYWEWHLYEITLGLKILDLQEKIWVGMILHNTFQWTDTQAKELVNTCL